MDQACSDSKKDTPEPPPMTPKFLSGKEAHQQPSHRQYSSDIFLRPFFFYGSLMDPRRLSEVLRSDSEQVPSLRPAHITGYRCKLWGPYPALTSVPGVVTHGMVCEVQDGEEVRRLQQYETDKYRVQTCMIHFDDGSEVRGETFVWDGEEGELREGAFDLEAWQTLEYAGHAILGDEKK